MKIAFNVSFFVQKNILHHFSLPFLLGVRENSRLFVHAVNVKSDSHSLHPLVNEKIHFLSFHSLISKGSFLNGLVARPKATKAALFHSLVRKVDKNDIKYRTYLTQFLLMTQSFPAFTRPFCSLAHMKRPLKGLGFASTFSLAFSCA